MITGGGTGGHVFPGLAIAEEFRRRDPRTEIVWVGTSQGLEARMGAALGYPLEIFPLKPLKGRRWSDRMVAVARAIGACGEARRLLRRWRPDLVVGLGGYVSGPLTLMAAVHGYPTVIHEQNRIAGLANRLLGRMVRRVCVTYPDSVRFFSARKTVYTGNPIRRRVMEEFTATSTPHPTDFVVLIFGGSQGAAAIDRAIGEALPLLARVARRLKVIHQVGRETDTAFVQQQYAAAGIRAAVHSFIDAIGRVYKVADLVICRAGAGSLAELTLVGRPAIVIPYPHAADNHQLWNARYLGDAGAAIVREERALTGAWLAEEIVRLMDDPERCRAMAAAAQRLARPDAAEQIVDACMQYV